MAQVYVKQELALDQNIPVPSTETPTPEGRYEEKFNCDADDEEDDFTNEPTTFTCNICSNSFVTRVSLARHMILHDGENIFTCSFCKSKFTKKEDLAYHIQNEHGGANFSCSICHRNFSRRDHLQRHIVNVHPEEATQSQTQPFNYSLKAVENNGNEEIMLDEREVLDIKEEEFDQQYTDNQIESDEYEEQGLPDTEQEPDPMLHITVEPELPINMTYQNGDFENDDNDNDDTMIYNYNGQQIFQNHLSNKNQYILPNIEYQTQDSEIEEEDDLDSIEKVKASLNGIRYPKFQCQYCQASFMTEINYQKHLATHLENRDQSRSHLCQLCLKSFARKEHLTKHLSSVHSGMRFTCEFCGKDISRKDHLIRHIRNVHPTDYFGIPELAQSQNLEMTINTLKSQGIAISEKAILSMQPKPKKAYLSCDMCEGTFTHINDLHLHQSTVHSDIRKFRCFHCPKAFKRKEHLSKHEVLHTGEKKHGCNTCGKFFPRKDALQDHIRRIHGINNNGVNGTEYPCNFCEKVFLHRPNLLRHLKNLHQLVVNLPSETTSANANGFPQSEYSDSIEYARSLLNSVPNTTTISAASSTMIPNNNTNIQIQTVPAIKKANRAPPPLKMISKSGNNAILFSSNANSLLKSSIGIGMNNNNGLSINRSPKESVNSNGNHHYSGNNDLETQGPPNKLQKLLRQHFNLPN